jgi:hypothetical protein
MLQHGASSLSKLSATSYHHAQARVTHFNSPSRLPAPKIRNPKFEIPTFLRPSAGKTPQSTRLLPRAEKFEIRNSKFEIPRGSCVFKFHPQESERHYGIILW